MGDVVKINKSKNNATLNTEKINENNKKSFLRYHVKLEDTKIYYLAVDIEPEIETDDKEKKSENIKKENTKAIMTAWDVIKNKLIDLNKIKIGDAYKQEILKVESVVKETKDN